MPTQPQERARTRSAPAHAYLPPYVELPLSSEGVRVAWTVFGTGDECGTVTHRDRAAVLGGLAVAVDVRVLSLDRGAGPPDPHRRRPPPRRVQRTTGDIVVPYTPCSFPRWACRSVK